MNALAPQMPAKRVGLYIAVSLALHAILITLWQMPPRHLSTVSPAPPVVFDLTPAVVPEPVAPTSVPVRPQEVEIAQEAVAPAPQAIPQSRPVAKPEDPPPRSILFGRTPDPSKSRGLTQALPTFPSGRRVMSGREIAVSRMKGITRRYRDLMASYRPKTGLIPTLNLITREGTAFYAAYAAHNVPAMVAVAGLSLTRGSLGKGIRKAVGTIRRMSSPAPELQFRDIYLLEQIARSAPITAGDLYLDLPHGWTYMTLREHLDNLVKLGKLTRTGKGHKAHYHTGTG